MTRGWRRGVSRAASQRGIQTWTHVQDASRRGALVSWWRLCNNAPETTSHLRQTECPNRRRHRNTWSSLPPNHKPIFQLQKVFGSGSVLRYHVVFLRYVEYNVSRPKSGSEEVAKKGWFVGQVDKGMIRHVDDLVIVGSWLSKPARCERVMVNGLTSLDFTINLDALAETNGVSVAYLRFDLERPVARADAVTRGETTAGRELRATYQTHQLPPRGPAPGRKQGPRCREARPSWTA